MSFIPTTFEKCKFITGNIELDLRNWIKEEIIQSKNIKDCIDKFQYEKLKKRSLQEKKESGVLILEKEINDEDILDQLGYSDSLKLLISNKGLLNSQSQEILASIGKDLEAIRLIRNKTAHSKIRNPLLASESDMVEDFAIKIKDFKEIFPETLSIYKRMNEGEEVSYDTVETIDERVDNNNLPETDTVETGFIERKNLNDKINKLISKYPVISFVGEGGTGKTALAVKICYDLMGTDEFERCVYLSFKSGTSSTIEFKELSKEINDSGKFFSSLNWEDLDDDPIKNVVKNLESQKTLLLLDNLESILDHNINSFIDEFGQAEHKSKILITSRRPVDQSATVKVGPFEKKEALDFFRRLINFFQLTPFKKMNNEKVMELLDRVSRNPLFIKWAVGAISKGDEPDTAFKLSKDQLNYCFLNIFKKFDDSSKEVLKGLYYLKQELTRSIIVDVIGSKSDPSKIVSGIKDLLNHNFISQDIKRTGAVYYKVKNEVIPFLEKNKFYDDMKEKEKLYKTYARVTSASISMPVNYNEAKNGTLIQDWNRMMVRKKADAYAAQICETISRNTARRAKEIYNKQIFAEIGADIERNIEKLKISHPDYCEVYRVEGNYHSQNYDPVNMMKSYEIAIQLEPEYQNLYCYYAERLGEMQKIQEFLEQAKKAVEVCTGPETMHSAHGFLLEAKCYNLIFDNEAKEICNKVIQFAKAPNLSALTRKKLAMKAIRFYHSLSEYELDHMNNPDAALQALNNEFKLFNEFEKINTVDFVTVDSTISRSGRNLQNIKKIFFSQQKDVSKFSELSKQLDEIQSRYPNPKWENVIIAKEYETYEGVYETRVHRDTLGKDYTIHQIRCNKIYFNVGPKKFNTISIKGGLMPKNAKIGDRMSFKYTRSKNARGKFINLAINIKILPPLKVFRKKDLISSN